MQVKKNNPATEICGNGIDDDCDGLIDEGCSVTLNLRVFIEGFYMGGNSMQSVLLNADAGTDPLIADTVIIQLHDPSDPSITVSSDSAVLDIDGWAHVNNAPAIAGGTYYISVLTRNGIETWSKLPVTIGTNTTFDFTH